MILRNYKIECKGLPIAAIYIMDYEAWPNRKLAFYVPYELVGNNWDKVDSETAKRYDSPTEFDNMSEGDIVTQLANTRMIRPTGCLVVTITSANSLFTPITLTMG